MINSLIHPNNELFSQFPLLYPLICFIITSAIVIFAVLVLVYVERRALALFTLRYGPNRTGKEGILQPVADAIKLLIKGDLAPKERRKFLFFAAPIMVLSLSQSSGVRIAGSFWDSSCSFTVLVSRPDS